MFGFCMFLGSAKSPLAADGKAISLWLGTAPGDQGGLGEEKDTTKPSDGLVSGKPVIRLGNVSTPQITVHRPSPDKDTGASVLVCPGGGYHILAMDLEGTEVVEWLNSIGVTGVLLKYRVPARSEQPNYKAPLQDAQRAMGLLRQNAEAWGIDPKRIGVMGFSAGGHLSAALSCNFEQRLYAPIDDADRQSCRPDFVLLIYPAYLTVEKEGHKISPELKISEKTPPAFIVQTQDDGIPVETSVFYYLALKKAGIPVEMHLYPTGGHGYGLRPSNNGVSAWPQRAAEWMQASGLLGKKK